MRLPWELYQYMLPFLYEDDAPLGMEWRSPALTAWAGVCKTFRQSVRQYISSRIVVDSRSTEDIVQEIQLDDEPWNPEWELDPIDWAPKGEDIGTPLRHLHRLLSIDTTQRHLCILDPEQTLIFEIIDDSGSRRSIETYFEFHETSISSIFHFRLQNIFETEEERSLYRDRGDRILIKANEVLVRCLIKMPNLQHVKWATGLLFLLELPGGDENGYMIKQEAFPKMEYTIATTLSKCKDLTSLTFENNAICDIRTLSLFTHLKRLDLNTNLCTTGMEMEYDPEDGRPSFLRQIFESNKELECFAIRDINTFNRNVNYSCLPYWASLDVRIQHDNKWQDTGKEAYLTLCKSVNTLRDSLVAHREEKCRGNALTADTVLQFFMLNETFREYYRWCQEVPTLAEQVATHFNNWYDASMHARHAV